jgi:hypothetical protein
MLVFGATVTFGKSGVINCQTEKRFHFGEIDLAGKVTEKSL